MGPREHARPTPPDRRGAGQGPALTASLVRRGRLLGVALALVVTAFGALALVGWWRGLDAFVHWGTRARAVRPLTAAAFVGAGLSLLTLTRGAHDPSPARRVLGRALALVPLAIGLASAAQGVLRVDLGIDRLLFPGHLWPRDPGVPGRMTLGTATMLSLYGVALLVLAGGRTIAAAQGLGAAGLLIGLVATLGHAYGSTALASDPLVAVSAPTSVVAVALGVAVLCARADAGPMAAVTGDSAGGALARRLLPAGLAIPPLLGAVAVGASRFGLLDAPYGTALAVALTLVALAALVWSSAVRATRDEASRAAAESQRSRFVGLLDLADEPIFAWELGGVVTYWNHAAEALYGHAASVAVGRPPGALLATEQISPGPPFVDALRATGAWQGELSQLTAGGRRVVVDSRLSLVVDPSGRRVVLEANRDVTARHEAARERDALLERERAARCEMEKAARAKDEFLAVVSHELRTPLTAILGFTELCLRRTPSPDKLRDALVRIERNAKVQAALVEDLLDVSRMISGRLTVDLEPLVLGDVARAAVESARPAADERRIRLSLRDDSAGAVVHGSRTRLAQVFANLLTNALKFTPPGGRVDVALAAEDDQVLARVRDSGEGLAPEALTRIFDRFRQADSSMQRRQGGLGLGLAIVAELCRLHGGAVWAESEGPGRGATFVVRLPRAAAEVSALRPTTRPTSGDAASLDGVTVLAIDDEASTREVVAGALASCRARVVVAGGVLEGLRAFEAERPDVVVCDLAMPDLDGYALLERVRALPDPRAARTPVLALTAHASVQDRERALRVGFDGYLAKPFDLAGLSAAVAALAHASARAA
jgi:PAS domain S-box-containing protein